MLNKINFGGGLNTDSDDRLMQNGDYRKMINCRSSITGVPENIPSNIKIDFDLPVGTNKVIGQFSDELNDTILFFVSNSNNEDLILEYDARLEAVVEVLRGDLGFEVDSLINHVDAIGDLRMWTDGDNPPRKINIEKAKSGFYTVDEQSISAVKYAPNYPPTTEYRSSPSAGSSNIRGKLFQFRYKFVYTDKEESAWSPISYVPIPNTEFIYYPFGDQPSTVDNEIKVTVRTGTYLVDRIKVAVREITNSNAPRDFYLAADLDKDELGISDNTVYDFIFDGEDVLFPIPIDDSNRLYDFMPLKAQAQAVTEDNRIVYGGVTEGYDNVSLRATASPIYLDRTEEPTLTVTPSLDIVNGGPGLVLGKINSSEIVFTDIARVGDVVSLRIPLRIGSIYREDTILYQVQAGDTYSDIIDGLAQGVANSSSLNPPETTKLWKTTETSSTVYSVTGQFVNTIDFGGAGLTNWYTELIPTGTTGAFKVRTWSRLFSFNLSTGSSSYEDANTSAGSVGPLSLQLVNRLSLVATVTNPARPTKVFKSGSQHKLAIIYYDAANRSGLSQESKSLSFETDFFSKARPNGITGAKVTVNHQPPEWAVAWQIGYSGRTSIGRFVHTRLGTVVSGSNGDFSAVLDPLTDYNTDIDGVISYDFVKGDRLRVILDTSDQYIDTLVDVEIVSFDNNTITFKGSDSFDMTTAKFVELYAPRDSQEDTFYYEIGRAYPIRNPGESDRAHGTNGEINFGLSDLDQFIGIQPATIHLFDAGDVYYKERNFDVKTATPDVYPVEDVNYSDFYASAVWDKGRPNIADKNFSQKFNEARMYFTERFIEGSLINGSSTVYDVSFQDYERSSGSIKKLHAEDNQLIMFQERKVSKVLVNENVLYDSSGNQIGSVGQQSQVLSEAIAYAGEFGIGCNPESFAVYGNRKYFIDAERGAVLRLGLEGITPISTAGRQKFFTSKMKELLQRNKNFNAFGGYDIQNGEYVISFESQPPVFEFVIGQGLTVIEPAIEGTTEVYNEMRKRWLHTYQWLPEMISRSMVELFMFKDGSIYRHPLESDNRNNFFGVDYPMIVSAVANHGASDVKVFQSVFTESTDVFEMTATTPEGQATELIASDYDLREGVYYANLLRDQNTPGVTNPLLNGDNIRSYALTLEFTNESTSPQKLFSIGVRFDASMLTNS